MFVKAVALLNQVFRVDVRQLRTHLLRGALAAAVLFLLFTVYDRLRWISAPGHNFFGLIASISFVLLSLCGAFYFPSVITEEKEQQTLGLLRMAGVGPATLLIGKSLGRLGVILLLMAVTLPYWWLAVTLGGVTWVQVAATGVVLASHLVLVSQIGTFFSVICRTTGRACVLSTITILALMIGPIVVAAIALAAGLGGTWLGRTLNAAQYWFAPRQLTAILSSGYAGGLVTQQGSVNLAAAAVLFGLSWLLFDVCNTYAVVDDVAGGRSWTIWKRSRSTRTTRPSHRPGARPIVWKEYRMLVGGRRWMALRFGLYVLLILSVLLFYFYLRSIGAAGGPWTDLFEVIGLALVSTTPFLAAVDALYLASHVFHTEVRQQTWDSLRMLPISLRSLCLRKIGGALLALIPAIVFFAAGSVLSFDEWLDDSLREFGRWPTDMSFAILYGVIATLFALYLTCYFSLKTNPWLGIVLSAGVWVFTFFAGMFCCFGVLHLDRPGTACIAFWLNSVVVAVATLGLHIQIAGMLRGEIETG